MRVWGIGPCDGSTGVTAVSAEVNKEKVRRFMEEAFGQDKPQLVNDLLDPDFVRYDPYIEAGEVRGAQTVKENIVWFHNAFPDLSCTIEEQVAEGEKVVSRWTVRGAHRGEFFGVAGTGNRVEFTGIQIDHFDESGKILEERAEFDLLGRCARWEPPKEADSTYPRTAPVVYSPNLVEGEFCEIRGLAGAR